MEKVLTIIDGPRLVSCGFATRQQKIKKGKLTLEMTSSSQFNVNEKEDKVIISWLIESDTVEVPFKFAIEVEALFKIARPVAKKELIQAGKVEAGPILFVLLREVIADLTRKADLSPFYPDYPDFRKLEGVIKKVGSVSKKKKKSVK